MCACAACLSDVDVARRKIYFAFKTDTTSSEVRSLSLDVAADDVFDSGVRKNVQDEIINGL